MKKILSILVCVCVLLSAMVITASAAETSATITFDNSSKAEWSSTQQLWQENGITVINNKASSTTNIDVSKKYSNPARFYSKSDVIVEYPGMTKIVIVADASKYVAPITDVISDSNATVTTSGTTITIELANAVDSFTITAVNGQTRVDSITVYAASAEQTPDPEPTCKHTATSCVPNGDETHKVVCDACTETITPVVDCVDADINGKCDTCTGNVALPEEKTIAEVFAMADGDTKFYVTAEIVDTYRDTWATYGNFILKDDSTDETIIMFGLHDEAGNQYDAMETKPVVGDTIKVLANRSSYKGVGQLANAVLVELIPATPDEGGEDVTPPADDEGGEDVTPPADDATLEVVDTPVAGTAYKFGMVQGNLENAIYYLAGGMDGYYLATTTDAAAAIDLYIEETTGGYYLYTMVDGAKTYINFVTEEKDGKTYVNGAYEATASTVYTYDADAKTMVATVNDELYWLATRNDKTYTTLGPAKVSYEGFYGQFYAEPVVDDGKDDTTGDNTTTGGATTGGTTGGTTTGGTTTGGTTTGGSTTNNNTNTNTNTNTDNSTTSPDTGDNVGAFAVMAIAAAAVVIAASKKFA